MEFLLNSREMKQCDENTSREFLLSPEILMERAALAFTEEFLKRLPREGEILVLCGTGNNGGDGLAIARLLFQKGCKVSVLLTGAPKKGSLSELQLRILRKYRVPEIGALPEKAPAAVIDAIFGTGLSRDLEGEIRGLIEGVNAYDCFRAAVDLPSGVSADNGRILGTAFRAALTVTFAFRKLGHVLYPGAECVGELICRDIGITEDSFLGRLPQVRSFDRRDLSLLPSRPSDSNKGDFGKLLIIAGSPNMGGAAFFAGLGAYRAGCGLVRFFTPEENRIPLLTRLPEAILTTYRNDKYEGNKLIEAIHWADTVLLGPGLSTSETARKIFRTTMDSVSVPLVIDADGLNLLSEETESLKRPHTDIILTPHIGEMARLTGDTPMYLKEERIRRATEFASEYNVILTMKDSRTVTAIPYGKVYLNQTGNSGMAKAGSGDALSGVIAGLAASGLTPELAAPLGVFLHGLAGDLTSEKKGKRSMLVSDLLDNLCDIIRETEGSRA